MNRRIRPVVRLALIASLIATLFAASAPTSASQGWFLDDDDSIFEADIEALANAGITTGCNPPENTYFCPGDPVTRGQMAAFLTRGLELTDRGSVDFVDDDGSIFEADIEKLAEARITLGCNPPANDRFCPGESVTRSQMAAFLTRALGLTDRGSVDFVDDDGSIFEADIEKLATAGITLGCNPPANDRFCPNDRVTRGQMAAFLTRALDLPTVVPSGFSLADSDMALVKSYWVEEPEEGDRPDVHDMQYWPRGFKAGLDVDPDADDAATVDSTGRYAGWDVLAPSTRWRYKNLAAKNDWFHAELRRDARVAVVWRDGAPLPSWLSGWESGGTVSIDGDLVQVYEKDVPAGELVLGSVEYTTEWRETYLVLLAEADGDPTPAPPTPAGFALPTPSASCPSWVHGLHTTVGPDGATYPTWHPQIDPAYWCYFGHEHGSSPELIPGRPEVPYGYVADKLNQDEPNIGFKEFIFKDMAGEHWVRFVIHANTSSERRVCTQFHTLHVEAYDLAGALKFSAAFKADYGAAFSTSDGGDVVLTPTNCGYSMPALASQVDSRQNREINVGAASNDYERWDSRAETTATYNLGISVFDHSFDIRDPMSHCNSVTCNSTVLRDPVEESATRRTLGMASGRADFTFDADHALGSGEYYTDPFGLALRSSGAADAVRQYAAPGFTLAFAKNSTADDIECVAWEPWTVEYTCYQIGGSGNPDSLPSPPDLNLERSIWRN